MIRNPPDDHNPPGSGSVPVACKGKRRIMADVKAVFRQRKIARPVFQGWAKKANSYKIGSGAPSKDRKGEKETGNIVVPLHGGLELQVFPDPRMKTG